MDNILLKFFQEKLKTQIRHVGVKEIEPQKITYTHLQKRGEGSPRLLTRNVLPDPKRADNSVVLI